MEMKRTFVARSCCCRRPCFGADGRRGSLVFNRSETFAQLFHHNETRTYVKGDEINKLNTLLRPIEG